MLAAPLALLLLLNGPVCARGRAALAGLPPGRGGVADVGLVGLLGRWALYATGGVLGAAELVAGAVAARTPAASRIPARSR